MSPDQMNTTLAYHSHGVSFHFEPNINPRIQWRLSMIIVFTTHFWEWNINFFPVRAAKVLLKLSVFHTYIVELSLCLSSIFMLILISHFYIMTKERRNQFSKREKDVTSLDNWVPEKRTKKKFCRFSLVPVNWLLSKTE